MSSSMAEASASALERFLMTKFRTTTPPLPPSSCGAINGNFYSTGDQNGYDSRSNTLTMHTFRPNDDTYNSAYGSHGNTFSSSMNAATPPQKPFITPAMYCPQSEPTKLVKPSAYYESTAAYRANMIGTVQNFPHPLSSLNGNAVPNGQHRALIVVDSYLLVQFVVFLMINSIVITSLQLQPHTSLSVFCSCSQH
ncbi:unnamed protein product [Anisakis simplex]|uniref:Uncharacterized protein n=1 Tax=Anisakis simplex TaxID=6269 RepID=A0A0M3IYV7_ANISI|nr:unnamed protein product [Anisakis simplex]